MFGKAFETEADDGNCMICLSNNISTTKMSIKKYQIVFSILMNCKVISFSLSLSIHMSETYNSIKTCLSLLLYLIAHMSINCNLYINKQLSIKCYSSKNTFLNFYKLKNK